MCRSGTPLHIPDNVGEKCVEALGLFDQYAVCRLFENVKLLAGRLQVLVIVLCHLERHLVVVTAVDKVNGNVEFGDLPEKIDAGELAVESFKRKTLPAQIIELVEQRVFVRCQDTPHELAEAVVPPVECGAPVPVHPAQHGRDRR
jgi:hypothetical protein